MSAAASDRLQLDVEGEVVQVRGDLTMATASYAVRRAADMFAGSDGAVAFDLSGLEHADSAALAVLLEWRREAQRRGRELSYRNVPERLKQLSRISELESILAFGDAV